MREALSATPSFRTALRGASFLPTECLAFSLAGTTYAVDMRQVQELRGYGALAHLSAPVAQRRRWLELRGTMVPHLDLRSALGLPLAEPARSAVVVVVALDSRLVCFTADGILGVQRSDMRYAPRRDAAYGLEVRTAEDDVLRLLDLDRLLEADALRACPTVPDHDWTLACADAG